VGAGWSTAFLAHALERNERAARVTLIEPEPDRRVLRRIPGDWDVRPSLLQLADLEPFEQLEAGDICFYDGSHCVRAASDVNWFFFEVLPRLAPGVLVHVHDIYLPDDYHDEWLLGDGLSWNEQYFICCSGSARTTSGRCIPAGTTAAACGWRNFRRGSSS
jgi:hypothetical protein